MKVKKNCFYCIYSVGVDCVFKNLFVVRLGVTLIGGKSSHWSKENLCKKMAKNDHMVQGEQRHFLLWRRKEANQ